MKEQYIARQEACLTFSARHWRSHVVLVTHLPSQTVRAVRLPNVAVVRSNGTTLRHDRSLHTEVAGRTGVALDPVSGSGSGGTSSADVARIAERSSVAASERCDVAPAAFRTRLALVDRVKTLVDGKRANRTRERIAGSVGTVVASRTHVISGVNI